MKKFAMQQINQHIKWLFRISWLSFNLKSQLHYLKNNQFY